MTAECDLLRGEFESSLRRLDALRPQVRSRKEESRVYRLRVTLHVLRASYSTAVDEAIHVMKLHGIEMSAHPSADELEAAVAGVWNELGARSIDSLQGSSRSSWHRPASRTSAWPSSTYATW